MNHAANDRSILDRVMDLSSYNGSPLGFVILLQIADCFALRFINLIVVVNGCILYYVMNHAADDRSILNRIMYYAACNGCILLAIFLHAAFCFFLKVGDLPLQILICIYSVRCFLIKRLHCGILFFISIIRPS